MPFSLRKLVIRGVLAAFGLALVTISARVVLYQGLIAPVRVVSGSMADALVGQHYRLVCADCGCEFHCDRALPPPEMRAVCPNCGYADVAVDESVWQPGQRVLIDQLVGIRDPGRWEMIAFKSPGRPDELAVKRVVGLPGEGVAIREGDLYIDGRIARKNLAEQRATAILVHDNDHRPGERTPDLPPRWQADNDASGWKSSAGRYAFNGSDSLVRDREPPLDWLTYRHWRCVNNPYPRTDETPIRDNYGYNQGLSRQLHIVTDLMLVCRLDVAGAGRLVLRINGGRNVVEAVIEPAQQRLSLIVDGSKAATVGFPERFIGRDVELTFSAIDRQAIVAVDGEVLLQEPLKRSQRPLAPTSRPAAIGARQVDARVERLRIYRDLHYLDPRGFGEPWPGPTLGDDELFVLGDNVPISHDSRAWREPLRRDSLVGGVTPMP